MAGRAQSSVDDHRHKGAVETVHGWKACRLGIGHALRHHQGCYRCAGQDVQLHSISAVRAWPQAGLRGSWRLCRGSKSSQAVLLLLLCGTCRGKIDSRACMSNRQQSVTEMPGAHGSCSCCMALQPYSAVTYQEILPDVVASKPTQAG